MAAIGRLVQSLPEGLKQRLRSLLPDETRLIYDLVGRGSFAGVMIDVGAFTGDSLAPFAERGWTVFAFEPDEESRAKLYRRWGQYTNVHIDARAISNEASTGVTFYRSPVSDGISGLAAFHDTHEQAGLVDTTTLAEFTAARGVGRVDFLKVDTEGYDLFVLEGVDWSTTQPDIVLCEFEDSKTRPLGYSFDDLASFLLDRDYAVVVSEWYPIVEYGQTHRWRRLAQYPCSLADPNAWGNLIAVKDDAFAHRLLGSLDSATRRWRIGAALRRLVGS